MVILLPKPTHSTSSLPTTTSTSRLLPFTDRRVLDRTSSLVCLLTELLTSLCRQDANAIGPGIGPAAIPAALTSLPPAPASLPQPPLQNSNDPAYTAATVSSGPQPASLYPQQPPPVMLPPLHYQGLDAAQPFGYQPPAAPMMHPAARMPPPQGMAPPSQAGMVRSADEMEGSGEEGMPPAKRQKYAKLPAGQYYPEQDWINMHPVSHLAMTTVSSGLLLKHVMLFSIPSRCKYNSRMIPPSPTGNSTGRSSPSPSCPSTCSCQRSGSVSCSIRVVRCRRRKSAWHTMGRS